MNNSIILLSRLPISCTFISVYVFLCTYLYIILNKNLDHIIYIISSININYFINSQSHKMPIFNCCIILYLIYVPKIFNLVLIFSLVFTVISAALRTILMYKFLSASWIMFSRYIFRRLMPGLEDLNFSKSFW